MTIQVDGQDQPLEQVTKQLHKLINVIKITDLTPEASVERELVLIKVRTTAETRGEIIQIAEIFRARLVDVAGATVVVEITGAREKVDAMISSAAPVRHRGAGAHRQDRHGEGERARVSRPWPGCRAPRRAASARRSMGSNAMSNRIDFVLHEVLQANMKTTDEEDPECTTTTTRNWSCCRARRWPSSASAARAMRTPRTCATAASRWSWPRPRARRVGNGPRRPVSRPSRRPRRPSAATSSSCWCPIRRRRPSTRPPSATT